MPAFKRKLVKTPGRLVLALLILLCMTTEAWAQIYETKLTASDGSAWDSFGKVALSGDRALISATGDDENGDYSGSVYIFERQLDGSWLEVAKLTASDAGERDYFGASLALHGDRAVVGIPWSQRVNTGAVYVFERQGDGSWAEIDKLIPAEAEAGDQFGGAVSIQYDRILAGASNDDDHRGAAYLYERQSDGSWVQVARITAENREIWDQFGRSVSVWQDRLLITSWDNEVISGEAYIFERQSDGKWVQMARFIGHDTVIWDGFGFTASLWEDRAMVGSNGPGPSNGAYIFERQTDGTWKETAAMKEYYFFGTSVSISGDRAIGGADIDAGPDYTGGSHLYERQEDGSWVEVARILASDRESYDYFGQSLAIDGDLILVGAPGDDDSGENAGAAYVYDLSDFNLIAAGFTLIDAETDRAVPGYDPIPDGAVLNLKQLPRYLNLRANTTRDVESVRFDYTDNRGRKQEHVENLPPYALYGDAAGDYAEASLPLGEQTITAAPFSRDNAGGEEGKSAALSLTVVREDPGLVVSQFMLVDAETDRDLFGLYDGTRIYRSNLPPLINIRAEVLGPAKSVRFTLDPIGHTQVENVVPYALFGDVDGDYFGYPLGAGTYTLTATAYRQPNATGIAGDPKTLTFEVIDNIASSPGKRFPADAPAPANALPAEYALASAYPNPFNPTTTIRFALPEATQVRLIVYDLLGREVGRLVDGVREAGNHEVTFDASDLPSGTYLYRLETPEESFLKTMILMK